jgi:hypothetical protein
VRLLGDPQIFELVTGSNEFATGRAIGLLSRGHSVNSTALKTRLGRLKGHDQGCCCADCTPDWPDPIHPGHEVLQGQRNRPSPWIAEGWN